MESYRGGGQYLCGRTTCHLGGGVPRGVDHLGPVPKWSHFLGKMSNFQEKYAYFRENLLFFPRFFLYFFLDFFPENFEIFSIFFSKIFLKPAETGKKSVFFR